MPSDEKTPFYDPVPPTYDEATGGQDDDLAWRRRGERSAADERGAAAGESQGLLHNGSSGGPSSSRRAGSGYHAPTVETDDEDSLWDSSGSEADEADQVRREMQEMEVEEPGLSESLSSAWGKRMRFLSLPQWKWSWRPRLPRFRVRLPQRPDEDEAGLNADDGSSESDQQGSAQTSGRSFNMPQFNGLFAIAMFTRILAAVIVLGFVYLVFASNLFGGLTGRVRGGFRFNPEDLRIHVQQSVDPERMKETLKHFSSYAHIAGTEGDYATAMDTERLFLKAGLDEVVMDEYFVYLNYPKEDGRAVEILDKKGKKTWSAKLDEDDKGGETAGRPTLAFHGHSKSGDVKGPLIYANYGSREDYQKLKDDGIKTDGAIALVRYYGTQTDRALKVKGAELAGFAGCLIYSDPADDGFRLGEVAPKGPYMPKDGVQRGAVSLMSWVVGDVLTPGWESKEHVPRMKVDETPGLVHIPSLPLAWRDAQVLLQHLQGHGQKVPKKWRGGVPEIKEWWTGDESSPIVRLKNEQDENEKQPIWNVYGKIIGMEQGAKSIILGNHRDAWSFGATDPHTGTAVMIEMVEIFGDLVRRGWRPLRTIEFMSWDAEEYNLIGSTEYVENNLDNLRANAYAYINLDTVVSGPDLRAGGSPVMRKTLMHALNRVVDPNANATLKDIWEARNDELQGLGAGSDYVAFQDIAGTSSLDLEFSGTPFPYHSSYDNFDLMEQVLDPGFVYHGLLGEIVGLLLLDLADRTILPFDMKSYGNHLTRWVDDLAKWAQKTIKSADGPEVDFDGLKDAAALVKRRAEKFDAWQMEWDRMVMATGGWEANDITMARLAYNDRMADFDTKLLDLELGGGIPNRTQFKHVVFGPQLWSGYDEAFFPAIRDVIEAGEWDEATRIVNKTAAVMRQAAGVLVM